MAGQCIQHAGVGGAHLENTQQRRSPAHIALPMLLATCLPVAFRAPSPLCSRRRSAVAMAEGGPAMRQAALLYLYEHVRGGIAPHTAPVSASRAQWRQKGALRKPNVRGLRDEL